MLVMISNDEIAAVESQAKGAKEEHSISNKVHKYFTPLHKYLSISFEQRISYISEIHQNTKELTCQTRARTHSAILYLSLYF